MMLISHIVTSLSSFCGTCVEDIRGGCGHLEIEACTEMYPIIGGGEWRGYGGPPLVINVII